MKGRFSSKSTGVIKYRSEVSRIKYSGKDWIMLKRSFGFILLISLFAFGETVVDDELRYSTYLPDNWVREVVSSTQHRFYDTTYNYRSYVTLIRYDLSIENTYQNAYEWARANYLAYRISVSSTMSPEGEALSDPFGVILYPDSSEVKQNDTLWAAEIYSIFFTLDTSLGSWAEFIRFTGFDKYGYEIYAIGDTADMSSNLGVYAAIFDGIKLTTASVSLRPQIHTAEEKSTIFIQSAPPVDLLGRRKVLKANNKLNASGVLINLSQKVLYLPK